VIYNLYLVEAQRGSMRTNLSILLALVFYAAGLSAQNTSGTLRGVVEDATKACIAGATIAVERPGTSQIRRVTSDAHGEFRIEDLAPGFWRLTVEARGFATSTAEVAIGLKHHTQCAAVALPPTLNFFVSSTSGAAINVITPMM